MEIRSLGTYLRKQWISTTIFFTLNLILLFILLRPYINRSGNVERNYGDVGEGLPTPLSYLYPSPDSLLWNWMRPIGDHIKNAHEHTLWMGLSCILAIIGGIYLVRTKKDKVVKFWLFSFLLMILITLNFYGHVSFYAVVYLIPGFEAVRAVSRIVQLEVFFLGGLMAVVIDHLIKKEWNVSKKSMIIGAIALFVCIDQLEWKSGLNSHSKKNSQFRVEFVKQEFIDSPRPDNGAVLVYVPYNNFEVYKYHMDAMLASQDLKVPTINGYSAFSPKGYDDFFAEPNAENLMPIIIKHDLFGRFILIIPPVDLYLPPQ